MNALIRGFLSRGGASIVFSGVSVKIISLLLLVYVARVLDKVEYGNITYALLVITFLIPLVSGSFSRTYLRYGSLCGDAEELGGLFAGLFRKGLISSLIVLIIVYLCSDVLCHNRQDADIFLEALSLLLVFDFVIGMLGSHYRIKYLAKKFALMNFLRSFSMAAIVLVLMPHVGGMAYVIALVVAPLISCLFISGNREINSKLLTHKVPKQKTEVWRFLLFVSLSATLSKSSYVLGGITIGNLIEDPEALAQFRVASLIPINLLILPTMYFTSEYVHITENHANRTFVINYLKHYTALALSLVLGMVALTQLFGEKIITLTFGQNYTDSAPLFEVMMLGLAGAFLLRQPFGNLLSASGRADLNVVISIISTIIMLSLLIYLISIYGLMGAAAGTAIGLWATGLLSLLTYFIFVFPKLE